MSLMSLAETMVTGVCSIVVATIGFHIERLRADVNSLKERIKKLEDAK